MAGDAVRVHPKASPYLHLPSGPAPYNFASSFDLSVAARTVPVEKNGHSYIPGTSAENHSYIPALMRAARKPRSSRAFTARIVVPPRVEGSGDMLGPL